MFCNWLGNPGLKVSAVSCGDLVVCLQLPAVETAGYYDPSRVAGLALREANPLLPLYRNSSFLECDKKASAENFGTETELVVYEHEGHMFASPAHQRDVIERVAAWFDRHLE